MRILVTGSSGQIGTNLSLSLLAAGHEVLGVDDRPNTWTDEIDTQLVDLVALAHGSEWTPPWKPDCIVHLAAWAKVHRLVVEPEKALENVEMTFAALELARAASCPIIFGSSREVYGDIHRHITDEAMADFVVAESPYSASKIAGEAFFYSYARCYAIPHIVFRFSNVYGRFDNDLERMERVIPLFVKRIAAAEPIRVFGKDKMLDFTFVDDCVAGVHAGVERLVAREVENQTINLAFGEGRTLGELVTLVAAAIGCEPEVSWELPQTGEVTRYVADITKARALLGYEPTTPLSDGIPRYIAWCRETGFIE
jgi:nucleoside-diphosphate-sugar epimerase